MTDPSDNWARRARATADRVTADEPLTPAAHRRVRQEVYAELQTAHQAAHQAAQRRENLAAQGGERLAGMQEAWGLLTSLPEDTTIAGAARALASAIDQARRGGRP